MKGGYIMNSLTKLDNYDCIVLPGVIRIALFNSIDPSVVDILSEIRLTYGRIYVEDNYYQYLDDHTIHSNFGKWYLDLDVVQIA